MGQIDDLDREGKRRQDGALMSRQGISESQINSEDYPMRRERTSERICPKCGEEYGEEQEYCPEDGTRLRTIHMRPTLDDPLLGQEIDGRFSVEKILGEGGMGKVYAGKQLSVGREVAIKVLRAELTDQALLVKRFFREAQVISQFSHPNIVRLIDFGQDVDKDVLYLVMEFINGTELGSLIEGHRLKPELAVDIIVQACEALSEPHSSDVIHRDLKPENLMLVPMSDGRIQTKVVDFGIAHALQTETKLTQTGSVFGTVQYMAPEQARGAEVGPPTDVYALGCILFELLTGLLPFTSDSAMGMLMAHVQEPIPALADILPGGEDVQELSELVIWMMQKEPEDRPATVLEVRDRLETLRRRHNHSLVRVNVSAPPEQMFDAWLLDALGEGSVGNATSDVTATRDTGVGFAHHQTNDSLADPFAGTAVDLTGEVHAQQQASAVRGQTARFGSGMTSEMEVQGEGKNSSTKMAVIALIVASVAVMFLAAAVIFMMGQDSSEQSSAEGLALEAEEELMGDEELIGDDGQQDDDDLADDDLAGGTLAGIEEAGDDEGEDEEVEEEAEIVEEIEQEEEAQPEPPRPTPTATPRPTPRPAPTPRPPQPEPEPEPTQQAQEEESSEPSRPAFQPWAVD